MTSRCFVILFPLALIAVPLGAAPRVSIDLPFVDPALTELAAELTVEGARYVDDVNAELEDIDVDRPLLMGEFGIAASRAPVVRHAIPGFTVPEIYFGVTAVASAHPLDNSVTSRVSDMDESSDEAVGAAIEPFVVAARFPLDRWGQGSYAGASLGIMRLEIGDYRLRYFSLGASLGRRIAGLSRGAFRWDGLSLECGADVSWTTFGARYRPGTVERTMTLDADGSAPLAPFNSTFAVDPDVLVALKTRAMAFTGALSTGVTVIDAISLSVGMGLTVSGYHSELTVTSDDAVAISGQLAALARSECRVRVSGSVCEGGGISCTPYYQGCARFGAGALTFSVPVIWSPKRTLGLGLYAGIGL